MKRKRVVERLASAARRPIALVIAPAGYGKTTALQQYLEGIDGAHAYFRVRPEHAPLDGFVQGLADALAPIVSIAPGTVADALRNAASSRFPARDLAHWLSAHLAHASGVVVVDDLHLVDNDTETTAFLTATIDRNKENIRWIIAARALQNLPIASWLAYGDTDLPLNENDLAFTYDEVLETARALSPRMPLENVGRLLELTGGWPTALRFSLLSANTFDDLPAVAASTRRLTHQYIAEQVYNTLGDDERHLLTFGALLPSIDAEVLEAGGFSGAAGMLEGLHDRLSFLSVDVDSASSSITRYQCHDIFRDFLEHRLQLKGEAQLNDLLAAAARALHRCGDPLGALRLLTRAVKRDEILAILSETGFDLLDQGHLDTIRRALEASGSLEEGHPVRVGLLAQLEIDAGRFDRARGLFESAIDVCADRNLRATLVIRLSLALFHLGKSPVAALEPIAFERGLPRAVQGELLSLLLCGYAAFEQPERYAALVEQVEQMAAGVETESVRAKMLQRIGYAAFVVGDGQRGARASRAAASLASELGLASLAASAHGISCNLAYLYDDDPQAGMRFALLQMDAAARANKPFWVRGSMATQAFLAARMGDVQMLDRVLHAFEGGFVDDDPRLQLMVLEAQAYRAAWVGDFALADEHLRNTADPTFAEDRLVKKSVSALIALGAGRTAQALELAGSLQKHADAGYTLRPSIVRFGEIARWCCTLVEILAGKTRAPALRPRSSPGTQSPLAEVLRDLVLSVARDLSRGPQVGSLEEEYGRLRALGYGGFALLIEALLRTVGMAGERGPLLTPQQLTILKLMAAGNTPKEIALETNSSLNTVRTHIKRIIAKFECSGSDQAIRLARTRGLI